MSDRMGEFPELKKPAPSDNSVAKPTEPPEIEAERVRWRALALRVAAGDEDADREFCTHYTPGVRVMLRRSLGSIALESLVDETLAGALEEIRRGSIDEPMHFVQFVRSVIDRQLQGEAASRKLARMASGVTVADRVRLKEATAALRDALATFTKREREILVGYYSRGLTAYDLECLHGATTEELNRLRGRLQELAHPHGDRKAPSGEHLVRKSAAAG